MSNEHTQGRLHQCTHSEHRLRDDKGAWAADVFTTGRSRDECSANARRLAACWNYFSDGISTEIIESDSYAQMRASFAGQRDALERARVNLAYYQGVMCLPGAPKYKVQDGDVVPVVAPVRVAALVDDLAAARALLEEIAGTGMYQSIMDGKVRAFLRGRP